MNIIGNGVVLDPALFKAEAEALEASGHNLKERLHISKKAHLILPTHRILDAAYEAAKGDAKVELPARASVLPIQTRLAATVYV